MSALRFGCCALWVCDHRHGAVQVTHALLAAPGQTGLGCDSASPAPQANPTEPFIMARALGTPTAGRRAAEPHGGSHGAVHGDGLQSSGATTSSAVLRSATAAAHDGSPPGGRKGCCHKAQQGEKGFLLSCTALGWKRLQCDAQRRDGTEEEGWDRGGFFCPMSMGRMSAREDGAALPHSAPPPQPTAQNCATPTRQQQNQNGERQSSTEPPRHSPALPWGNGSAPLRIPNKSGFGAAVNGEPFARGAVKALALHGERWVPHPSPPWKQWVLLPISGSRRAHGAPARPHGEEQPHSEAARGHLHH